MKLLRLGSGAILSLLVLTVWVGACSTNDNEVCGIDGLKNGVCNSGTTCPSGQSQIAITDPDDQCPSTDRAGGTNYICCAPSSAPSSGGTSSTTTNSDDSGSPITPVPPDATPAGPADGGTNSGTIDATTQGQGQG